MLRRSHRARAGLWYEIRELRRGDIEAIRPREDFAREQRLAGNPLRQAVPGGLSFTVTRCDVLGEVPVACGGFRRGFGGVWMAWAYTGDLSRREWGMVARAARHGLEVIRAGKGRAVEMLIRADDAAAANWARQLGFDTAEMWEPPADWTGSAYRVMRREFGEAKACGEP